MMGNREVFFIALLSVMLAYAFLQNFQTTLFAATQLEFALLTLQI